MDIFKLEFAFKSYLTKILFPKLKIDLNSDIRILIPPTGVKTIVRLVEIPQYKIKIAVRISPQKSSKDIDKLLKTYEILEKNQVLIPRRIDLFKDYSKSGVIFWAEEWIDGKVWDKGNYTDDMLLKLSEKVSMFHQITSDKWGDVSCLKERGFSSFQLRKVNHRLSSLKRIGKGFDRKELKIVWNWFKKWDGILKEAGQYELIHDKMHSGNVVVDEKDKSIIFLDLATTHFSFKEQDLAMIFHELFDSREEHIDSFLGSYFSLLGIKRAKEDFEKRYPFFHAYYHLSRCSANLRRDKKFEKIQNMNKTFRKKFEKNKDALFYVIKYENV